MEIIYKGKKVDTDTLELIGGNCEGNVYAYGDDVLKVYKSMPEKVYLPESECEKLALLKTKRILLPIALAYKDLGDSELEYVGCGSRRIRNIKEQTTWNEFLGDIISDEAKYFDEDLDLLSENGVEIYDLHNPGNMISDGKGLYFCDAGSYNCQDKLKLKETNLNHLNESLHSQLFMGAYQPEVLDAEFERMFGVHNLNDDFYKFIIKVYEDFYTSEFEFGASQNYLVFLEDILSQYNNLDNFKPEVLEQAIDSGLYDYGYPLQLEQLERILH